MENPEADSSNIHQDQADYNAQIQHNVQVSYDDNSNDPAYCDLNPKHDQSYQPLQLGDDNGPNPQHQQNDAANNQQQQQFQPPPSQQQQFQPPPQQQQQFQPPQQQQFGHAQKPPPQFNQPYAAAPPPKMQVPMQIAQNPPAGAVAGQWTTGLCGCCEDPSNCVITFCCPCITFSQNAEIIDRGATSCFAALVRFYFFAQLGVACLYSCGYRTKLRGLHSLPGDPCADFIVHCCCMCCALSQEYRELKNCGFDPSIGWATNAQRMNQGAAMRPPKMQGMGR